MIDWGTSTEPSITMSYPTEAKQLVVDEAAAVGILQHLDKNELQNLLDDSDKLDSLIQDLQQVNNCFSCGVNVGAVNYFWLPTVYMQEIFVFDVNVYTTVVKSGIWHSY